MNNIEIALTYIIPEIKKLYPKASAYGLGGSRAQNNEHKFSDWDFLVVDNSRDYFSNEAQYIDVYNCEIFVGSLYNWKDVMSKRSEEAMPIFINMIKDSVPLSNSDDYSDLQKYAVKLYKKGPKPLDQEKINFIVQQLEFARDKVNGIGFVGKPLFKQSIIQQIIDSWYELENCWREKAVDSDAFIQSKDGIFYDNLIEFIGADDSRSIDVALMCIDLLIKKGRGILL